MPAEKQLTTPLYTNTSRSGGGVGAKKSFAVRNFWLR